MSIEPRTQQFVTDALTLAQQILRDEAMVLAVASDSCGSMYEKPVIEAALRIISSAAPREIVAPSPETGTPRWTPGVWHPASQAGEAGYEIVSDDGTRVASVVGGLTTEGDEDGEDGESESNAVLVAEAPALAAFVLQLADWNGDMVDLLNLHLRAKALVEEWRDNTGESWIVRETEAGRGD